MDTVQYKWPQTVGIWLSKRWYHPIYLVSAAMGLPLITWLLGEFILPTGPLAWLTLGLAIRKDGMYHHQYLMVVWPMFLVAAYLVGIPLLAVLVQAMIFMGVVLLAQGRYLHWRWSLLLDVWVIATAFMLFLLFHLVGASWLQSQFQPQMIAILAQVKDSVDPSIPPSLLQSALLVYLIVGLMFDVFVSTWLMSVLAESWLELVQKKYQGIVFRIANIRVSQIILILTGLFIIMSVAFDGPERYNGLIPSLMVLFLPYVVAGYGVLYQKVQPKPQAGLKLGNLCFHLSVLMLVPVSAMILGVVGLLDCVLHFRQSNQVKR